jgi:hypothetical protein
MVMIQNMARDSAPSVEKPEPWMADFVQIADQVCVEALMSETEGL